ncbi:MAG: C69 family dipeptidase [Candidatus Marinimicrobia bacterium]|nr:C69 family dipeptidase [Candidatus Neomarinimicrobiota bacterium]
MLKSVLIFVGVFSFIILIQAEHPDWAGSTPDGCTSVTVGRDASASNSVTTSHTCDSHRTRSWLDIAPARDYAVGAKDTMEQRVNYDSLAMPTYRQKKIGTIPQARHTYKFIDTAYPCMNEHQLAIGESTFGGRETLRAKEAGLIDCQQLVHLMIERCQTARGAIRLADSLTKKYGYNDYGECLTIADTKEVWHFEIVGPGKGKTGAVWVARRVPDGHVSVVANGSRIRQIDPNKPDYFMASDNVYKVAQDSGWWNPENGEFEFCYAYSPESRESMSTRRREWRVFDLVAPSLDLHPNAENYPFSVKPDTLVTRDKLVQIFRDYYQGTRFDVWANLTQVNEDDETIVSPFSNPFMPYEMNRLFNINGGWGWRGERQIARWYTMYATITQSRESMPDEIGGVVWLALDNVATSVYIPVYSGVTDLPQSYKTPGRENGFTRKSAWWAFNRLGTLTAQRFRDMVKDVQKEWDMVQSEMFARQKSIEAKAMQLYEKDPEKAIRFLTDYTNKRGQEVVKKAWEMGDMLWTKYDEKF